MGWKPPHAVHRFQPAASGNLDKSCSQQLGFQVDELYILPTMPFDECFIISLLIFNRSSEYQLQGMKVARCFAKQHQRQFLSSACGTIWLWMLAKSNKRNLPGQLWVIFLSFCEVFPEFSFHELRYHTFEDITSPATPPQATSSRAPVTRLFVKHRTCQQWKATHDSFPLIICLSNFHFFLILFYYLIFKLYVIICIATFNIILIFLLTFYIILILFLHISFLYFYLHI